MAESSPAAKYPVKKIVGGLLGLAVGLTFAFLPAPDGLTRQSMIGIGIFLWAIIHWVFNVYSFFLTAMAMGVGFALFKVAPFATVYSGFTNTTWWFMLGAMGMSAALQKSGLMKRFAYNIMKLFSPTFRGQAVGLMATGAIITPLIPSVTAKTAMGMPIAKGVADSMGYAKKSKELHGLWLAAFVGFTLTSYCFVSSNFFCYFASGLLPAGSSMSWLNWLLASLVWGVIILAGSLLAILFLYKPKKESSQLTKEYITGELKVMGPLSRNEKITGVIFIITILMWITENLHGISGNLVAILGLLVLIVLNVISVQDFKNGVPWDMLLMIGTLMGMGAVLKEVKITEYIANVAAPLVNMISGNVYLFIICLSVGLYIIRYVYSDVMSILAVFMPLLLPLATAAGISPWIVAFTILTSSATWNVIYQNTFAMQGFAAFGGEENVKFGSLSKLSYVYMGLNLVGLLVSVPIWQLVGLIH